MPLFEKGSRSRRALFGCITSFGVTLILLFAIELFLRVHATQVVAAGANSKHGSLQSNPELLIYYTPKGKRLIPNSHVIIKNYRHMNRDIKMDINSLGLRDDEIPVVKKKNEIRVLVLGDSITWGDFLQADEVYMKQAEKKLNQSANDTYRMINAGIGDAGTREEIDLLVERGLSVQPDIVALSFYLNDSRPPWGFPSEMGSRGWLRRNSVFAETVYREFKLASWIRDKGEDRFAWISAREQLPWARDRNAFMKLVALASYDWGAAWRSDSWRTVDPELQELETLSRQHNFKVLIIGFPVAFQVYSSFVEDRPQSMLAKKAAEHDFYYLDLLPLLRANRGQHLFFDHCHPNEFANRLIGNALADYIQHSMLQTRKITASGS